MMAGQNDCVFCKIAQGQLPAHIVYEDAQLMAIMDAFPATQGHVLIIPKAHAESIYDLPPETAAAILPLAQELARKIKTALHPDGLNILQNNGKTAGQVVFHYHMHLIPRYTDDGVVIKHGRPLTLTKEELAGIAQRIGAQ
ncbi:MAG: HIT family protein [Defluviitaleaceae bacterium]|nr:HIT family protein [Defluviitaleaceae bacterium]MCL2238853.1 HIT family protein [Defluviitaleaceae bacterium]